MKLKLKECLKSFMGKRLVMLVALCVAFSLSVMAQSQKVILKQTTNTVAQLITEIENQTTLSVDYGQNTLNLTKEVKTNGKEQTVESLMKVILDGSSLKYSVVGRHIVITSNKETANGGQTPKSQGGGAKQKVSGQIIDNHGEPLVGVAVRVKGTNEATVTDIDGNYSIMVAKGDVLEFSYIGFTNIEHKVTGGKLDLTMKEDAKTLNEVVVTAMGIVRKATSLTYATQQVKSDELMRVEDVNLVNSLDGKISGVTITPAAGGAGGSSKILLRGNKSIQGNNKPLIVVDGIPMTNSTRGEIGGGLGFGEVSKVEGGDPLSQINPDDIESINVLKGANAAALYGSAAANGVVMITTKRGKEGRLDITFNSNITFDTPLLTPEIQNVYGINLNSSKNGFEGMGNWGDKLSGAKTTYFVDLNNDNRVFGGTHKVYLRDYAEDDVANFFKTGVTTNNSFTLSGGTEKSKSYVSYANSHSTGMLDNNTYNRHTFAYRQSYRLWNRLSLEASANYVQTRTKNRVGGGIWANPMYDLYTMPRNTDFAHYSNNYVVDGSWSSRIHSYYPNGVLKKERAELKGPMQDWVFQAAKRNNPYWLLNQNEGKDGEDRFYGNFQARLDIYDGLVAQARVSIDHTKQFSEGHRAASTWNPDQINDYGNYWVGNSRTNEIYIDYLLTYNKTIKEDWLVNATAGWVGHTIKGEIVNTYTDATVDMTKNGIVSELPTVINLFDASSGGPGTTSKNNSSDWNRAVLATAQIGWKDAVYVDASYRVDWYRSFKQARFYSESSTTRAKDHYGYFGLGANTVISNLVKLPKEISYLKYRISYSEVGNAIPNKLFDKANINYLTGAISGGNYNSFTPKPETMKSFETGIEAQFFNNALNFDLTYYNTTLDGAYLEVSGKNGKTQPVNTCAIRNQGIELTLGYDWIFAKDWRWKTSANFSYNDNKILQVNPNELGVDKTFDVPMANGLSVRYINGGKYGDMYVTDYTRWRDDVYKDADGKLNTTGNGELVHKAGDIYVSADGSISFDGNMKVINERGKVITKMGKKSNKFLGNMNAKYQLSWSNTLSYKNFTMFFLINGRIGGKVVSLTEAHLDRTGSSQRTADARLNAEANNIKFVNKSGVESPGMYINEGRDIVPIKGYYESISNNSVNYVYDATNFRLREFSLGYTFRNLMGEGKNLSLSFIGRNLFFLYKKAPVDPDVSLSTANGAGGVELFNLPSSRSYGFNLKLNF